MAKTTDPKVLLWLAQGLVVVAGRLEPQEAARLSAQATASLSQAMAKTTDSEILYLYWLGQAQAALAGHLDPQEAARHCSQAAAILFQAMAKTTHSATMSALAEALSAVLTRVDSLQLS
jgi:hypothetical protein